MLIKGILGDKVGECTNSCLIRFQNIYLSSGRRPRRREKLGRLASESKLLNVFLQYFYYFYLFICLFMCTNPVVLFVFEHNIHLTGSKAKQRWDCSLEQPRLLQWAHNFFSCGSAALLPVLFCFLVHIFSSISHYLLEAYHVLHTFVIFCLTFPLKLNSKWRLKGSFSDTFFLFFTTPHYFFLSFIDLCKWWILWWWVLKSFTHMGRAT